MNITSSQTGNGSRPTFTCAVVGGTSLLIRCAEMLLERGHHVCPVVSADAAVVRWARENDIQILSPVDSERLLSFPPFDYLFSIVNERILGADILALPRKLAINYHDGPLPKYAGTHATSWALLNREKTHGITWHVASEQVDAGNILEQRLVEIDAQETAFTLNTKCYEAAFESCGELIGDLSWGKCRSIPQDQTKRTFFPRLKRPARAGMLTWKQPADEIAATVRALDFGPHPNPLGSAKASFESVCFLVPHIGILDSSSHESPGTVVAIDQDSLTVATGTNDVVVRLASIDGEPVTLETLIDYGFAPGRQFDEIEAGRLLSLEELNLLCAAHEKFWVKRLSGLQAIELPQARRITSQAHSPCRRLTTFVPDELTASRGGCDGVDFLLTAWAAYLYRISSADYFDLGLRDFSLRSGFAEWKSIFASYVPLRVEVSDSQTLSEFFLSFQSELRSLRRNQTYLQDLPARYPEIHALASDRRQLPVRAELVETLDSEVETSGADLTLLIRKDARECCWVYDPNAFELESVERMARQFEIFLAGYAANTDCPIAKLPLMPEDELRQVLVEWNETNTGPAKHECMHHLFESQVELRADQPALIFDQEVVSYRELNERANQLARFLRKLGVGRESLVGICLTRSTDLIVGLMGILKAGGAYVPLDSAYPSERLAFIVEDTALRVIVTQKELIKRLPSHQAQVVCVDSDREKIAAELKTNLAEEASAENLAYLIYTSGSTGRPKGVAIEHRSAVTLLEWAETVFTREEISGVLASTSICFDLSIFEIFVPLSCGGKIILADNALHLPSLRAAEQVTLVNTVPSAMTELVRMKGLPASVRTVNLAGEPLQPALVEQIYRQSNARRVFDLYGPSEDTTYSTYALRQPGAAATIGRPVANTQVYILDKNLQPVPIGVSGELYLGGAGLARGYLNRPDLTRERFIRYPFNDSGARLYRTGDLARYRTDGNLEYLGRIDHQVKIRGFRIELGEIETVLNQHPAVSESVVIAHEDGSGGKNLAAYVVPRRGSVPTTLELREFLKDRLPQFMLPAFVMMLESLPLTPNGKLDRKALPKPESTGLASRGTFVAPSNPVEQHLVKTWEEILKTQPIGVQDNFFELGGHSLLAVELFVRIETEFGKKFPLATLFQAPTIKQLASLLLSNEGNDSSLPSLVPIQPNGSKPPFFCIHARGGNVLFYRDLAKRLGPDQPFYGLQMVGLDGKRPFQTRVEDMAAHYLKEIRTIQPTGPYFLGGASFGGTAAYEMAQQLLAQGEQVALLALFDTTGPGYPRILQSTTRVRSKVYGLVRSFDRRISSLRLLSAQERVDYLKQQRNRIRVKTIRFAKRRVRSIAPVFPAAIRRLIFSPATTAPWALVEMEKAITQALKSYVTRPYAGRLTLFRASKQPLGIYPDPTLGWGELVTGELEIHEVPGFHGAIVAEPHVRFLAEQLKGCIEKAQQDFSLAETPAIVPQRLANVALVADTRVALQV